jgi:hypothetical protein
VTRFAPTSNIDRSPDYGQLQRVVDKLYEHDKFVRRLDVIMVAETYDLPLDLLEIVSLLPPGRYNRQRLCDQLNSSLTGHAWGQVYGTVQ